MNYILYPLAFIGLCTVVLIIGALIWGGNENTPFPDDY
jgi:hypothetical protein